MCVLLYMLGLTYLLKFKELLSPLLSVKVISSTSTAGPHIFQTPHIAPARLAKSA